MMVADTGTELKDVPDSVQTVSKLMAAIERLRGERDTLRHERDDLRRDFEFLKVESKFTIETLQKKARAPTNTSPSTHEVSNIPSGKYLQRAFTVSILVAQHLQAQQQYESARVDQLSKALSCSQGQLSQSQGHLQEQSASMRKIQREDAAMRDALTTAEVKLASAESRVSDLTSLVQRLEEDITQERGAHEEVGVTLAQVETQLAEANKALEDSEAQRASLALQVSHLEQDLATAKADLLDAEARYSTLQAQQLASMSDSAARRTLKEQIEVLEGRVLRRTEQIGIHQHDIKRLETNLRLQEERVTELTAELEVADAEKKAMVEDCSNTREERDEALRRCEKLEEDIEMMDESRESELQTLVGLIVKGVEKGRTVSLELQRCRLDYRSLSTDLQQVMETRADVLRQAEQLQVEHGDTLTLLQEKSSQLRASQEELREASSEAQHATLALATLYHDLRETAVTLHNSESARISIEQQFQAVRVDLQAKLEELSALRTQYEAFRSRETERTAEFEIAHTTHVAQVKELEDRCHRLERAEEEATGKYQQALLDLEAVRDQIRVHASDSEEHAHKEQQTKRELEDTQHRFEAEASGLRDELASVRQQLEDARVRQASAESEYRQALEDADNARRELQQSLDEAIEKLQTRAQLAGDLETSRARYEEEVDLLKDRLRGAERELEELKKDRDDHITEHAKVVENLEQQREESSRVLREKETVDAELSETRTRLEYEVKLLEDKLDGLEREREELKHKCNELEVRSDHASHDREDLEEQLRKVTTDADLLLLELKAESDGRLQQAKTDAETLEGVNARLAQAEDSCAKLTEQVSELQAKLAESETTLQAVKEEAGTTAELQERLVKLQSKLDDTESALRDKHEQASRANQEHAKLREETDILRTKLEETEATLQALRQEEERLSTELTPLQAEVQKLLSERRFLEGSIQSRESEVESLQKQLEDIRAAQVQWEKTAKSAEVKLDLQVAQHNKTVESLRKEVNALKEAAKLEEVVADLQDKNAEMDELLRAKCQEIEENDDRFIKFLKDEKKLTAKVEFLTRKVKTLQDKLSATSSQDTTPTAVPLPTASTSSNAGPSRLATLSYPPPPTRAIPALPEMPDFSAAASSSRMRSSSLMAKSLSPEDRIPPPVFRPRTPEVRHPSAPSTHPSAPPQLQEAFSMSTSSSSIGKKRRAPDDFEDCDGMPPQTFTADSVPHRDGATTPRIRRALASVRTGFTPVRHVRPAPSQQDSPPRRATAGSSVIADVTNSPRSKQATKKGWLGKIKGGPGHSQRTATSSRARPQNP